MPVKNAFFTAIRGSLHAGLEEPTERIELPATGVQITTMRVFRKADGPDNDLTVFQNVLPMMMMSDPPILLRSPNWNYQPADLIVELVRKRLEQIEAEGQPAEQETKKAAEL